MQIWDQQRKILLFPNLKDHILWNTISKPIVLPFIVTKVFHFVDVTEDFMS